jgi:hypothetical protein
MHTTPLHPESDSIMERYINPVKEHLNKVLLIPKRVWDERPSLFLMAYREEIFVHMNRSAPYLAATRDKQH